MLDIERTVTEKPRKKKSGLYYGANKGHTVTPLPKKVVKIVYKKRAFQRNLVKETLGFKPYEIKIAEILNGTHANKEKKALKFAKNRLGSYSRAKKKVSLMKSAIKETKMN